MPGTQFQLLPIINSSSTKKLMYIFHAETGLSIVIYPLHINPDFKPSPDEICLYGQLFSWWHAFETSGFQEEHIELIAPALSWYSDRVFYPQMQPQAIDPRMAIIKQVVN
jgi:hypothetical protein